MGRYRKIDTKIWNDQNFQTFTDDGKLAFLLLLTHPHMTAIGAMRTTIPGLAAELGWAVKRFRSAIQALISKTMIELNERACYLALPNFLRYNEPEGPNSVIKAWPKALDLIPECPEKVMLLARCRAYLDGRSDAFKHAIGDTMSYGIADAKSDPCHIPEPEPEPEPEQHPPLPPQGEAAGVCISVSSGDIQQRWNAIPGVKASKAMGETIRQRLETRIKEHPRTEWWDNVFQRVQASDFLCGRINGNKEPFHVSLDWILGPKNLDKLLAGNYDPMSADSHVSSLTCTKRVPSPDSQLLRPCGQPVAPQSKPSEPRCAAHFTKLQTQGGTTC
jgi:hypothetical protein